MTKEIEEEPIYVGGYIPFMDLTQDDIDKVKKMIDRLNYSKPVIFTTESEEDVDAELD